MTRPYTHKNDGKIAALYLAGKTGDEIGHEFGITDVTVYRALKRQGTERRKSGPRVSWEATDKNREDLVAAYEAGESIRTIARRLQINGRRVTQILDEAGHKGRHPGGKRRFTDEDAAEFARMYLAGEGLEEIGRRYGAAAQVIRRYLERAGIQLRPVGAPAFWTEERKAEAARRYQAGEKMTNIAATLGCGTSTLVRTLVELGVHKKPRLSGDAHHSWRGGRIVDSHGYVRARVTSADLDFIAPPVPRSGYVLEHRLVMARKLGRPLLPTERPHHKNLIKSDNDPGNLELWLTSQPAGARVADLLEWSLNLLDQYMPEVLVPGWRDMPRPEAIT
jgi:transposase-like protein